MVQESHSALFGFYFIFVCVSVSVFFFFQIHFSSNVRASWLCVCVCGLLFFAMVKLQLLHAIKVVRLRGCAHIGPANRINK